MTETELKQQTRDVRDEFEKITDADVDGDQEIVAMRGELVAALEKARHARVENDRVRAVVENLQSEADQARSEIQKINEQRVEVIARSLLAGDGFTDDDELLERRRNFERFVERLAIARPALERQQRSTDRAVEFAVNPCTTLEDQINHRRDELKLREAQRRHGLV